jgi:hypothetical protein
MRWLGFEKLIDSKASRERDLVVAMVAGRIIAPQASKLAMTHAWADATLAEDFSVADAHEDALYETIIAKASMTSETWRCQPCQERVSM